jgi:aconitate hydratase
MLGQPVYLLTPDVVGVQLKGRLPEGATATDQVLTLTEMLRKEKVVGNFVEFFGEGAATLSVPDRATIGNMAPEYGATMGFFPVDTATVDYLRATGRTDVQVDAFETYFKAQGLFGMPVAGEIDYTKTLTLDLTTITPSLAGPKRPQDRIELPKLAARFAELFSKTGSDGFSQSADKLRQRYATSPMIAGRGAISDAQQQLPHPGMPRDYVEMVNNRPTPDRVAPVTAKPVDIGNGDVLIAAITSCTNTSNPSVLLAAGLLAKKAVEKGLTVAPHIKTSLAPGSRVVTDYLTKTGLLSYLERLGFDVAAYGCTTCIGNAGDLAPEINDAIAGHDLVCAAVLSGNRNFEARIHPNLKANFLASPPLVVAYAIAGTVLRNLATEPLGEGSDGPVYLRDVWPTSHEVGALLSYARDPGTFRRLYGDLANTNPMWKTIAGSTGQVYDWPHSTYIARPPFFDGFSMTPGTISDIRGARALGIFGDSVTTDHISPAGSIKPTSPAGLYLQEHDVSVADFNSYGSRRGNHEVMLRGTFANVRIKNLMLAANADGSRVEGGITLYHGASGPPQRMPIYDAAIEYQRRSVPTVVFGGDEYGTGSSRDWAAKGTQLLGIKAVIAKSFERIHRSNLVGMGVLPLQFTAGDSVDTLGIRGDETFDIAVPADIKPQQRLTLAMTRTDGSRRDIPVLCRIDTPIEVDYYRHGGILPFVLRELIQQPA